MKKDKRVNVCFIFAGLVDIAFGGLMTFILFLLAMFANLFASILKQVDALSSLNKFYWGLTAVVFLIIVFGIASIVCAAGKKVCRNTAFGIIVTLIELATIGLFFYTMISNGSKDVKIFGFLGGACLAPFLHILGLIVNRSVTEVIPGGNIDYNIPNTNYVQPMQQGMPQNPNQNPNGGMIRPMPNKVAPNRPMQPGQNRPVQPGMQNGARPIPKPNGQRPMQPGRPQNPNAPMNRPMPNRPIQPGQNRPVQPGMQNSGRPMPTQPGRPTNNGGNSAPRK